MSIVLPEEKIQSDFEQYILHGWQQAHGTDGGHVCSSWGKDRVVVMIEDVLSKAERLLSKSEESKAVMEQYFQELMGVVVAEQAQALSALLGREIVSTSVSANIREQWVMFILRLAE